MGDGARPAPGGSAVVGGELTGEVGQITLLLIGYALRWCW